MSLNYKTVLNWTGSILSFLAIVFVFRKIIAHVSDVNATLIASLIVPIIILSIIYGTISLLLSMSWRNLLRHFKMEVSFRQSLSMYGVSQLAKYIPGNIFHFVGRQAIGIKLGLQGKPLAQSSVFEVISLIISGSLFVILLLNFYFKEVLVSISFSVFISAVILTYLLSRHFVSRWFAQSILYNITFLILSGLIFVIVLFITVPSLELQENIIVLCGAFVVAWLIGYVTPGSPAGVGIREVILFTVLSTSISEKELLSAILISRLITVFGDVTFYLLSSAFGRLKVKNT